MRALQVLAVVVGLAASVLTVEEVHSGARVTGLLWYWPTSSFAAVSMWNDVQMPASLARMMLTLLAVHGAAIVVAFALARKCNRHPADWAAFALLFPPSTLILPLLERGRADQDRYKGIVGRFFYFIESLMSRKQCSRCRKPVPLYVRSGESCPHCQVQWVGQKTVFERYFGEWDQRP